MIHTTDLEAQHYTWWGFRLPTPFHAREGILITHSNRGLRPSCPSPRSEVSISPSGSEACATVLQSEPQENVTDSVVLLLLRNFSPVRRSSYGQRLSWEVCHVGARFVI